MTSVKVQSRNELFVAKTKTKIWQEFPTARHSYVTDHAACHGYSIEELIAAGYSQTDMTFLLLQGELPTPYQRQLLDALSLVLCNPGPRHPATRSVMEAAVSKTHSHHLLPIGLMVLSGENSAGSVEAVMRFMRINRRKAHPEFSQRLLVNYSGPENDEEIAPGFGPHYEQREPMYINLAKSIQSKFRAQDQLAYLNWSLAFDESLNDTPCGMKATALAASIFLDLGFHPRSGPGLFQLLSAPGLLAHGLEMISQPVTAMPFVSDENYHHTGD